MNNELLFFMTYSKHPLYRLSYLWIFLIILTSLKSAYAEDVFDSSEVEQKTPLPKKAIVKKVTQMKTLKPEAGLGDYIKVEVSNIQSLVEASKEKREPILLYFNEVPMHGINAEFISLRDSSIIFKLTRDTVSLKSWNIFYQGQTLESTRKVAVSVGFMNDGSLDTKVKDFSLILVRKNLLIMALIAILLLLSLFIVLVKKTGIIRGDNLQENKGPYSLSRTQLAFWSFIIIFSFIYIWIVTGEMPPVTGSTLILLTISMTTTAGAKVIDSSKEQPKIKMSNITSDGFFRDIISDYVGVSIHRFQMVVWTIILGLFFIRAVVKNLAMPQFDESLLILMGISSGTYLGLKIPEKSEPIQADPKIEEVAEDTPPVG